MTTATPVRKTVKRVGSEIIEIRAYAPGDGFLSFIAFYTQDNPSGRAYTSATPTPSRDECEAACPYGWVLFDDGGAWRARRAVS